MNKCPKCDSKLKHITGCFVYQKFKPSKEWTHIRTTCPSCGKFIGYLPKEAYEKMVAKKGNKKDAKERSMGFY